MVASLLEADTILGVTGDRVVGSGTLLLQIIDAVNLTNNAALVRVPHPRGGGHAYVAVRDADDREIVTGINVKGLALATVPITSWADVRAPGGPTPIGEMLRRYGSLAAMIEDFRAGAIRGPTAVIAADVERLVLFELLADGHGAMREYRNNTVVHTGFFVLPGMARQYAGPVPPGAIGRTNEGSARLHDWPQMTKEHLLAVAAGHRVDWGAAPLCRHREQSAAADADSVATVLYTFTPGGLPRFWMAVGHPCRQEYREIDWQRP